MIDEILKEMIIYSNGNKKDIAHFIKVHEYAKMIGKLEKIPEDVQNILEIAAIVHDIACPLCREKYGSTLGKYQELEGKTLAIDFLEKFNLDKEVVERVSYLVAHHHTYKNVDGLDYQILLEADFLVNGDEMNISNKAIQAMKQNVFKTKTGIELLDNIYQ